MKMKEKFQYLAIQFKSRSLKLETFEFPGSMQGSKRIMITLPYGIQTNSMLLRMISELPVIFPSSDLLIVVPAGCTEVSRKTGIHAMSPDLYSTNFIGLPKKSFFAKVTEFKASVLLDFETHKNVFNAMVSLYSGASLRVGLEGVWGLPIHNFQVKSNFSTDELKIYRSMVDILTSIQLTSVMPDLRESN
jgi:hypothetical protein